jgi:hypothetical protein
VVHAKRLPAGVVPVFRVSRFRMGIQAAKDQLDKLLTTTRRYRMALFAIVVER